MTRSLLIRGAAVAAALLLVHAARADTPAAARRAAVAELFAAGHATRAELDAAEVDAAVEAAALAAARVWAEAGLDDPTGQVARLSELVRLPAGRVTSAEPPRPFAARVAAVLRLEAEALPVDATRLRREAAAAYRNRIAELAAPGIATAGELRRAEANAAALDADLAELLRRRKRLVETADRLSDGDVIAPRFEIDPLTAVKGVRGRNAAAAAESFAALLDSRVEAAAAAASARAAADREARVRATDGRHRRPYELESATSDAKAAELFAASAAKLQMAAAAAVELACDAPAEAAAYDWAALGGGSLATEPAAFVPPLPEPADQNAGLPRRAFPGTADDRVPRRGGPIRGDDAHPETVGRFTRRPVRFGVSPGLAAPRAWEPGWTYSSGYAFGQKRWDLPPRYRYPRADAYGGPWYLPGSPTNRLRYQFPRFPATNLPPQD